MRQILWMLLSFFVFTTPVSLAQTAVTPHQQVEQITQQLLVLIAQHKATFDKDPQAFYTQVDSLLSPVIDFPSFTRSVMGDYGTRNYYQSLPDEAARAEYRQQYQRFTQTFKAALIQTYGKGVMAFNGQEIIVEPVTAAQEQAIKERLMVDVVQHIKSGTDNYKVVYKMRPDKEGRWLFRNVIIESVNVGQLYRNQFAQAMQVYQQNFAQVVDHWLQDSAKAEQQAKQEKAQQ